MRVLTVSASPCLTTKLSRMNSDVIRFFKDRGHTVGSAVWDHDTTWFTPDAQGRFFYETAEHGVICELYPFLQMRENSSPDVYEIMKKFQPDLVISIGDYQETDFVFAIKSMYPQLFKWVSVLTLDAMPLNDNRREAFDFMDLRVATTKEGAEAVSSQFGRACLYLPYGADVSVFRPLGRRSASGPFVVMNAGKNSQASGTAAFIRAVSDAHKRYPDIVGYLHTNLHDAGDYDLHLLLDRYGANGVVRLPTEFSGLNDGIPSSLLNEKYNEADVYVDASVRSATALTCLEAMATGCVPLVTRVGSLGEVVSSLKQPSLSFIESVSYVGELEEEYQIASPADLTEKILRLYELRQKENHLFHSISMESIGASAGFSRDRFLSELYQQASVLSKQGLKIAVESM